MASLRTLLGEDRMIIAPGGYDCITAMLIARAGYPAMYMGGASTSASLGFPDFGLITMTEMVANASRIARSIDIPLICDADTGFGNELNTFRAVQEYERQGVAAIHIEDQAFPKRCGHLDGKQLIPLDEYLPKIRAAVAARSSPEFMIIARSDARADLGLEEALRRVNAALEAGADMAFVEAPQSLDEVAAIPGLVMGPCLLNVVWGGKTPQVDLKWAEQVGYRLAIVPGLLMKNVIGICQEKLAELKATNCHPAPVGELSVVETFRLFGSDEWEALRGRFREPV